MPLARPEGSRIPPGQVLNRGFPILHAGTIPTDLTRDTWRLRVHGAVAHPFELAFAELLEFPQKEEVVDIHCVTSWTKLDTRWRGVPFRSIAERAAPDPDARFVVMECEQGFTTSLPMPALFEDSVLLAHGYGGAPLAPEHGGPVRMLVPQRYFYKSAKWLRGIKFVVQDEPGFWEVRGYSNLADPWKQTRYEVDDVREIHAMRKRSLFEPIVRG
ncbi:MAG: molybdopterin-dependent oxidoreductase [Thermoplasmata archaeon]|nr:molybdopterin-dependent oxidoreductase [Thermoplasmata archaeon]MCI4358846.1 molybdopterin-dependent oxidoreductase [Thermoplasmata archaeon]